MSLRIRAALGGCGLALGALMLGPLPCPGARPYQPVFGDPMLERWRWRTYPEMSGLDVQCLAESTDGTMWFGTANDLWSYDGFEWRRHTKNVGRIVTALCSQANGTMYAGGGWGISQFSEGQWTQLLSVTAAGRIAHISDIPIKKLACATDGSLWVATSWGALRRDQSTWTLYTDPKTAEQLRAERNVPPFKIEVLPDSVMAKFNRGSPPADRCDLTELCADSLGRIWFGTTSGQMLCYSPSGNSTAQGSWSVYNASDGVASGWVSSILALPGDAIWVVHAASDRASAFDGQAWRTIPLPLFLPAIDLGDVGGKLLQTQDGVIWLSARYALFSYRDGHWQKYEQPEFLYPSTRNAVVQSADGALWFAGPNSEIYRVDYKTPRWLSLEDLNFQWQSPTGTQWFLHRDGRIVQQESGRWTSYGVEDDVIDTPVALLGTRSGVVWVAGSHGRTAATARFDGRKWTRDLHPDFSFAVDWRGVFESSDGSVWFGAFVDTDGPPKHRNGLLQFHQGVWRHHHQPGRSPRADGIDHPETLLPPSTNPDHPIEKFLCLGESRDGKLWAGRSILAVYDGTRWEQFQPPASMALGSIECMLTTHERDLWLGNRESGAWRYDGKEWRQFQRQDGFAANSVRNLAQTADGSIWAATDRGSSRFDGLSWMDDVLPEPLNLPHEGGSLKASPTGELWINRYTLYWMRRAWTKSPPPAPDADFRTVRLQFRGLPPRTSITAGTKIVAHAGNLAVLWTGVMPWREPKEARLQFSYRLDGGPWSAFTSNLGHSFFALPTGEHRLEVRARDADFNVDPTPAVLEFMVQPPVWRQGWFIVLMITLGGLIVAQTVRVVQKQSRLRRAHDELEGRVRQRTAELEAANRELEAFSYSVSHDLRSPLRSIDGFSKGLLEDHGAKLDEEARDDLNRVRAAARRMSQLIDDMLKLSRVTRGELRRAKVNLSTLAQEILGDLTRHEPERKVHVSVAPDVVVSGDGNLLQIALENLLGNAWKFTALREESRIEFGVTEQSGQRVYFVRDNGAGFDMTYAHKLFGTFQRLHSATEFPGTGVGLAIVQRVIVRHGGRVWADSTVDGGATFFFTLGEQASA